MERMLSESLATQPACGSPESLGTGGLRPPPDPPRQNLHVNGDAVATTGVCSTAHLTEGLGSQRLTGGLPADEVNP